MRARAGRRLSSIERTLKDEPEQEAPANGGGGVLPAGEAAPADPQPLAEPPQPPPARVEPVVVARWIQLVMLPLGVLALWALARAAGPVLLLFIVAAVIALILNPVVKLLQRFHLPRGIAVALVYLGFFGGLGGAGVLLAEPIADQVDAFRQGVPGLIDRANASLASLQGWLNDRGIGVELQAGGQTALETLRDDLLAGSGTIVDAAREAFVVFIEASLAVIIVVVVSVYMLLYGARIGALVRRVVPPGDGTPEDDFPIRVQKAVSGYVRGQFLFSLIMGTSAGLMMYAYGALGIFPEGKTYAFFFGVFFGLMELVPYIGPALGATPPMLVALFNDPLTAVWVGIGFTALQQLEGHVVAPQVFGHSLRINPLLVIFALLIGGQIYGIVGAFVALPIAAILRETAAYLQRHLVLEPWNTARPAEAGSGGAAGPGTGVGGPPAAP